MDSTIAIMRVRENLAEIEKILVWMEKSKETGQIDIDVMLNYTRNLYSLLISLPLGRYNIPTKTHIQAIDNLAEVAAPVPLAIPEPIAILEPLPILEPLAIQVSVPIPVPVVIQVPVASQEPLPIPEPVAIQEPLPNPEVIIPASRPDPVLIPVPLPSTSNLQPVTSNLQPVTSNLQPVTRNHNR